MVHQKSLVVNWKRWVLNIIIKVRGRIGIKEALLLVIVIVN